MTQLAIHFSAFLLVWLCLWAVGWFAVAFTLAWMFFGAETLKIVNSDLEVVQAIGGWNGRKLYQGSQIKRLRAAAPAVPFAASSISPPFINSGRAGVVQFDYGSRTVRVASGLDEAEGELIIKALSPGLPASARDRS